MKAALIDVDDARWASVLEATRHDFYHLPGYVALSAEHESGEPAAVHVTDGHRTLLQPVIVRPIPGGGHDATTPYGYPGPLVAGSPQPDFLDRAFGEAVALLGRHGIVSLFVRLHPLLNPAPPAGVGTVVRGGDTVSIDLTLPPEEQWRQVRGNHRVHINRARRVGRRMRFDEAWERLGEFRELYRGTMARLSANSYYFFDDAYFDALRATLGDRLRLAVVEVGDAVAAAGLFVETCGIVQYHLSGSDPAYAREGLTKVLIDGVRLWGTERGDEALHLGGGTGTGEDPLFHFKAGFSDRRHAFHTLRVIVDSAAYGRLLEAARTDGVADDTQPAPDYDLVGGAGYFPAYRQPTGRRVLEDRLPVRALTVRPVGPDDAGRLASLFARIDTTYFRPHPMTPGEAARIARSAGGDVFLLGLVGRDPVAYGMLRGFEEGYETPSLGVATVRERTGIGYGRAMMLALHEAARERGARSIRLRVDPHNVPARRLYESLGYQPTGMERGEILMMLDL